MIIQFYFNIFNKFKSTYFITLSFYFYKHWKLLFLHNKIRLKYWFILFSIIKCTYHLKAISLFDMYTHPLCLMFAIYWPKFNKLMFSTLLNKSIYVFWIHLTSLNSNHKTFEMSQIMRKIILINKLFAKLLMIVNLI